MTSLTCNTSSGNKPTHDPVLRTLVLLEGGSVVCVKLFKLKGGSGESSSNHSVSSLSTPLIMWLFIAARAPLVGSESYITPAEGCDKHCSGSGLQIIWLC